MGKGITSYLKILPIIVLFVVLSSLFFVKSNIPEMLIHSNAGSVSKTSVSMLDGIPLDYNRRKAVGSILADSITSNEVLQRAYLMASFEWTPLKPIPKRGGGYYASAVTVTGVPYSSVKEINTYLFQDVSYHTFMTAVHSPMSVLYTEDISQPPYHGTNCATYYGAVCSSSLMWTFGINLPYSSSAIVQMPDFTINEHQEVDSLKVCDVIWKTGHVQMIYDMVFRDDTLFRITTFETSGTNSHIKSYTKAQFLNMWSAGNYVSYRYKKLIYSKEPLDLKEWEPVAYNDYLCPSKGDRSVYRTTDTVTIHIYSNDYDQIVLTKGASMVSSNSNNGCMQQYYGLKPGVYNVFLQGNKGRTAKASFEVVETSVSYKWSDDGSNVIVSFESSAKPEYVALCQLSGKACYYPISDVDRWRGYTTVPKMNVPEYYCKVLFRGEYGRIINVPIKVE